MKLRWIVVIVSTGLTLLLYFFMNSLTEVIPNQEMSSQFRL